MDNDEVDGRCEKLHKHFTTSSLSVLLPASFPSPTNIHATRSRMIAEFCNKRLFITSRSYSSFVLHLLLSHFSLLQEEIPFLSFPIFEFQGGEGDNCDVSCCNSTHLAFVRRERTGNSWRLLKKILSRNADFFFAPFHRRLKVPFPRDESGLSIIPVA